MDPIVTTLLTPAAILAFVTIARNLGVPTKLAPILAIVLATGFIFHGGRIQLVLARLLAPLATPLVNLAARFRRA